ncbi:MAG: SOS response-associated peptidase [Acidimicrobiales bacterium]
MCGRFVSDSPPDEIARYFSAVDATEEALAPSWNVAPTDDIYAVVLEDGARRLDAFRWGLVPRWAKDIAVGSRMINARAASLHRNCAFRPAFTHRRCLIPADGFYEWRAAPGPKQKKRQPYFIHRPDGDRYAFAGLWETWRRRGGDDDRTVRSATIITTAPNTALADLHDRMPVILAHATWEAWLDQDNDDLDALGTLLVPAPAAVTVVHPVSTEVNNVRSNGRHLIERMDPPGPAVDGAQATLL